MHLISFENDFFFYFDVPDAKWFNEWFAYQKSEVMLK